MHPIKKLAGQTAVYGLSTIVGRLLNFLLVPLYTNIFTPDEYGVVTELFAYMVFLQIVLTYGMETGFFRFTQKDYKLDTVFSTTLTSLFTTSFLFVGLTILFSNTFASLLGYTNNPEYIIYSAVILGLDAIIAIPFAKLRQQTQGYKFVIYKIVNISVNIGLNLFFLVLCRSSKIELLNSLYNPQIGVGYIFISNLVASAVSFIIFIPEFLKVKFDFDIKLLKTMLLYSLPLLISGFAGSINETLDRLVLKFWLTIPENVADSHQYVMYQMGIYGANTKIAVFMTLFVQTFRFAADPFYFSQSKQVGFEKVFADVMKYFIILGLLIFLGVILYIDIFKYFEGPEFFEGLPVVAPLLLGHLLMGIVYNLSFWYKLKDKTTLGIYIFVIGALVTIVMNYFLIPVIGYLGCAWANVACYVVMLIITYIWGQKYLPINYNLKRIFGYFALAIILYILSVVLRQDNLYINLLINTFLLGIFLSAVAYFEKVSVLIQAIKNILKRNGNKDSK